MALPQGAQPPPRVRTVRTLAAWQHLVTTGQEVGQGEDRRYVSALRTVPGGAMV